MFHCLFVIFSIPTRLIFYRFFLTRLTTRPSTLPRACFPKWSRSNVSVPSSRASDKRHSTLCRVTSPSTSSWGPTESSGSTMRIMGRRSSLIISLWVGLYPARAWIHKTTLQTSCNLGVIVVKLDDENNGQNVLINHLTMSWFITGQGLDVISA